MVDSFAPGAPQWQVLLLGGASGTGKTAVSYRLAQHFGIGLTEVDDFQVLLERMTTPEQEPVLHFWRTHPAFNELSAVEIHEQGLKVGRRMAAGLEAVIANHLESQTPVVLEGDFIHPELATQLTFGDIPSGGQVRGIFLYEADEQQLLNNFSQREPAQGPQVKRARVSWLYGQWLKQEAERYGLPAIPARPWDTIFDRIVAALPQRQGLRRLKDAFDDHLREVLSTAVFDELMREGAAMDRSQAVAYAHAEIQHVREELSEAR